jgi:hypothetical protein
MITKHDFDPQCITYSQMNLIFNARIYYRRLTTWTRAYIISRYLGIGSAEELFGHLYLESLDIGNMLQIVFGREYSDQYSQLLSQFAVGFRDLITHQMEGDTKAVNQDVDRLFKDIQDRAAFLQAINPYWSEAEYVYLLGTYLQLIIEEANAFASGEYSKDFDIYDRLNAHTNRMGDYFALGLYDYITSGSDNSDSMIAPGDNQCITYEQMNDIYNIRMFWFELVIWVRNYMLSRYEGIGNSSEIYDRLKQVPVDYVNALRQIFGESVAEDYIEQFNTYISLLDEFITAQLNNDIDEINRITQSLYQNADERAALIASINPFWDQENWRNRLYSNLRSTIDESTSFLNKEYARNIDIFSRLLDQAESTSNYFAQGIFDYINYFQ